MYYRIVQFKQYNVASYEQLINNVIKQRANKVVLYFKYTK